MRKMITSRDGFHYWCMSLVILVLGISQPAFSIPLGQIDDFEDGTALGWAVGAFSSIKPMVVETGGPAGPGDNYLELSARGGNGAGSLRGLVAEPISQYEFINASFRFEVVER